MEPPATPTISVTGEAIDAERAWLVAAADTYVELINRTRRQLGRRFDEEVDPVTVDQFTGEIEAVFERPARAANVTALLRLARAVDVVGDFPGFIVDERLGRRLAATIAGGEPEATLAEATFHYVDVWHDTPDAAAGHDDVDAGIAAGVQTRLPGWDWQAAPSPFDTDRDGA